MMKNIYIKNLMLNIFALFCILSYSLAATGKEQSSLPWHQWKMVGKAQLTWGFWKIYDSELYTPTGTFTQISKPVALVITYRRNIDAKDLLDATVDQWQHLGFNNSQIDAWLPSMQKAWPSVNKGDKLIYLLDNHSDNYGQFYFQPKGKPANFYSKLNDRKLSEAFINIWLSPKTSYPKLRSALIGINAN